MLEGVGDCDICENGEQALAAFEFALMKNSPYDLVCMDIMMPKMDGQETLRCIRQTEKRQGINYSRGVKVIMLSALSDPHSVMQAFFQNGATGYMVKPIQKDKLLIELENIGISVFSKPDI